MPSSSDWTPEMASLRIERGPLTLRERAPALPPANLGARLGGHVVDLVLFYATVLRVFLLATALEQQVAPWLVWPLIAVVPALNLALGVMRGQSIGKLIAGTRVVTERDERAPLWRLLLRYPARVLGLLDTAFIFADSRRTLHDRLSGTRVVAASASGHVYSAH
ncbi:MAG TPA: RDD family protein [Polyangiales bacterium]|nr:RDD family protein [Polyangiales bacterium]